MEVVALILILSAAAMVWLLRPRRARSPQPEPQPPAGYIPRWTRARIIEDWKEQVRFQKLLDQL